MRATSLPAAREVTPQTLAVAAAAAIGNFVSSAPIINSTFGSLMGPVTTAFGWSRAEFSGALTVVSIVGLASYPVAGWMADRFGARRVISLGIFALATTFASLGLLQGNILQLYAAYAVVSVAAAFCSTVLLSKVVSGWFVTNRGTFLGLTAGLGNGVGCAVMPILALTFINHLGWRLTYPALGLLIAVLGAPAVLFWLKEPPALAAEHHRSQALEGLTSKEAYRTAIFWRIVVAVSLGAGALSAVFTHIIPIALDHGFGTTTAGLAVSSCAMASTGSQIWVGRLLDRMSAPRIAAPFLLVALAGMELIQSSHAAPGLYLGGFLTGVGMGSEYGLISYVIPRYFGFQAYGEIYGAIFGMIMLSMGVTPLMMDILYGMYGSYEVSLYAIGGALAFCAALIGTMPAYVFDGVASRAQTFPVAVITKARAKIA